MDALWTVSKVHFYTWMIHESDLQSGKPTFAVPTLEFLGHNITAAGSTPAADHAAAIISCPPPSGHQITATFPRHGEFLSLFFAKLRTSVAPLN